MSNGKIEDVLPADDDDRSPPRRGRRQIAVPVWLWLVLGSGAILCVGTCSIGAWLALAGSQDEVSLVNVRVAKAQRGLATEFKVDYRVNQVDAGREARYVWIVRSGSDVVFDRTVVLRGQSGTLQHEYLLPNKYSGITYYETFLERENPAGHRDGSTGQRVSNRVQFMFQRLYSL